MGLSHRLLPIQQGDEIVKLVPLPIIKAFSLLFGEWEEANRESSWNTTFFSFSKLRDWYNLSVTTNFCSCSKAICVAQESPKTHYLFTLNSIDHTF